MTVLFNSHLLAEVELMCDRVAILREGRRVFEGSIKGLQEGASAYHVQLAGEWKSIIKNLGGEILDDEKITLPHGTDPAEAVATLVKAGVRVSAFSKTRRSLEDVYMEILGDAGSPN